MESKPATGSNAGTSITHDLPCIARLALGKKPAWSRQSEDLSINLISCTAGQGVSRHVNMEVDVLMIGIDGDGSVELDGQWYVLRSGQAVVIPKGAKRATRCDGDHFAYLTCHRNRSGLWPAAHGDSRAITRGGQS